MARRKASAPGRVTARLQGIDVTQDPFDGFEPIDWQTKEVDEKKRADLLRSREASRVKPKQLEKILGRWDAILKACESGYELQQIAKSIGVSSATLGNFLAENPSARQALVQAKMKPRDLCVRTILNAAKEGQWLPAAWWLERTCWQEFAKPEVKLQLLDRATNQNEVQQTFGGKSLAEINKELREQYSGNPQFQRAMEQIRDETAEAGSNMGDAEQPDDRPEG